MSARAAGLTWEEAAAVLKEVYGRPMREERREKDNAGMCGVTKAFEGFTALEDVSLRWGMRVHLRAGGFNGAGKTTLLLQDGGGGVSSDKGRFV